MTAEQLAERLTADIRRIENETTRDKAHWRMVVHVMNETLKWGSERLQQPRETQEVET